MTSKELAGQVVRSLDKHKAQDIQMIEVGEVTTLGDYFVIAAGSSTTQVRALADYVEFELKEQGVMPERVEGYRSTGWILIDYGTVIVHVFKDETREFYNLERLWQDGKVVDIAEFVEV